MPTISLSRKVRALVTLAAALVLVAACGKGVDLTRSKAAAFELLGKYGPPVSGLIGRHHDLLARVQALPADLPARAELETGLAAQQATISHLKGMLDGYAVTIENAGKSGKKAEIDQAAAGFASDMDRGVADVTAGLDALAKQVEDAEAAVKAAAPPVDAAEPAGGAAPPPP
ncbi:MAG TPA: hypothetical protein VHE35_19670, partial [Kofleriaceae bacterium]|nr:hypothetical protein [Kofleriaceae bacterium]